MSKNQKITPCLWFDDKAEEAADFYVSVFADSRIDRKIQSTIDTPGAKRDDVILVDFTQAGQSYQALNGGPHDTFNDAISLVVNCKDQAEGDRLLGCVDSGRG